MKHQSKENRASIVLFLLFLCFVTPRAKSQVLLENDSSDVCKVIDIVNVGLSTEIQKKYEKEYIATSVIVGYNLRKNEVEFYWLDDRYDFDLYSSQKGDSITLHYPHMSIDNRKRAIAMDNHSFQERIRENDSIYVDIDFFDLKLEPDSTILMCSDGLSNMVEDSEIEKIILNQTEELPQKGERLLREANRNGGKDNIAVILVEPFTNEVEKC